MYPQFILFVAEKILWYGYIILYPSVHQLMDIWVRQGFGLGHSQVFFRVDHCFSLNALLHQVVRQRSQWQLSQHVGWCCGRGGRRRRKRARCAPPVLPSCWGILCPRPSGSVFPDLAHLEEVGAACWSGVWHQLLLGHWTVLDLIKGNSGITNFLRSTTLLFIFNLCIPLSTTKTEGICCTTR